MSNALKQNVYDYGVLVDKVSTVIAKLTGNILEERQSFMVETRVKKRMMDLKLHTPDEYLDYWEKNKESENKVLVSLITTHHTFFFREFRHFEFLKDQLPRLCEEVRKRPDKTLKVWSGACSRGQEVYSLSMFLNFHLPKIASDLKYEVFGTDIDTESVAIAKRGIYLKKEINEAPMNYIGQNWARGIDDARDYVKAKPSIAEHCSFDVANLLEFGPVLKDRMFDVIFCRNVFIYFDNDRIQNITSKMLNHLNDHGLFFSGISESLANLDLKVETIGPSVYAKAIAKNKPELATVTPISTAPIEKKIYNILCVDDSKQIHKLLDKIFSDKDEFKIVGHAYNGLEAIELLKSGIDVDLMTLDIHMPEMDGITYLKKNFSSKHPPVIMVSSVSRNDSEVAFDAFKYGASDFVEKPEIQNLSKCADELVKKLKVAYKEKNLRSGLSSVDLEYQKRIVIKEPEKKLNIIHTKIKERDSIANFLSKCTGDIPPTVILFDDAPGVIEEYSKKIINRFENVYIEKIPEKLEKNTIYFSCFEKAFLALKSKFSVVNTCQLVIGTMSSNHFAKLKNWKGTYLLVEELNEDDKSYEALKNLSDDVMPLTSFPYMVAKYWESK